MQPRAASAPPEVLLVDATILDVTETASETTVKTRFKAMLRAPDAQNAEDADEVWTFVKARDEANANWLVQDIDSA